MARSTSSPVAAPGPALDAVRGRSLALNLLISLRPAQWTKNLFVFAGLLFGLKLFDPNAIVDAVGAFVVFCVLSGVVYLVNDITARESDRQRLRGRWKPLALRRAERAGDAIRHRCFGPKPADPHGATGRRWASVASTRLRP